MAAHDGRDDAQALAWHGPVRVAAVSRLRGAVRPLAALVSGVFRGPAVRGAKLAIAEALRTDDAVSQRVPGTQVFSVERATIPQLPSIEIIAISSERVGGGPLDKHELSVECTVSHPTEDGADELLDSIVRAVRQRLGASEGSTRPIALASGEGVLVVLGSTRWSISAADKASVVRGASVALSVEVAE